MSTRARYSGRHRQPGRHRAPRRRPVVPLGSAVRVAPVAVTVGVALVATTPQLSPQVQAQDAPSTTGTTIALDLLASRGTPVPAAAARSRTRVSPVVFDEAEPTATAAVPAPAAPATPAPAAAAAAKPAATPAKTSTVPAIQTGAQFAGAASAIGLRGYAITVYCAVRATFGITNIGGFRAGDMDHGTGHAVDVMISGKDQGDAVAAFVMAHAAEFHVKYIIWRQRIWFPGTNTWRAMADRGSITANHYDHVHVSVNG